MHVTFRLLQGYISHALSVFSIGESSDKVPVPDEFMNCKKAHEVRAMSEVVASLAEYCRVKQVGTCQSELSNRFCSELHLFHL